MIVDRDYRRRGAWPDRARGEIVSPKDDGDCHLHPWKFCSHRSRDPVRGPAPPRGVRGAARRGGHDGVAQSSNTIADAIGGIGRHGGGRGARPGGGIARLSTTIIAAGVLGRMGRTERSSPPKTTGIVVHIRGDAVAVVRAIPSGIVVVGGGGNNQQPMVKFGKRKTDNRPMMTTERQE